MNNGCKSTVFAVAIIGLAILQWQAKAATIDGEFSAGDDQFAIVQDPNQTWESANANVLTTLGSDWHLAVITSPTLESTVTNGIIAFAPAFSYYQAGYWAGGYQSPPGETQPDVGWTWVTGVPWNYTDWNPGEPNDGGGLEQFLELWQTNNGVGAYAAVGTWNDLGDFSADLQVVAGYIAERNAPIPEPSALFVFASGFLALIVLKSVRRPGQQLAPRRRGGIALA